MSVSSRTVYGRTFRVTPFWMWLLQRGSGVLLGPLVALHVWWPHGATSRLLDALLLIVIVAHGYSGLTRLAPRRSRVAVTAAVALAWTAVVLVAGVAIVAAS